MKIPVLSPGLRSWLVIAALYAVVILFAVNLIFTWIHGIHNTYVIQVGK
jgi:hypothetical protein